MRFSVHTASAVNEFRGSNAALAPAAYASRIVLPPPLQGSLPAGWLAFTGRELNPLDRYKGFRSHLSSPFSGFILAQGKFHSITSSAIASSLSATSRPSAFAVLRLITSSKRVGCSTGR